MSPFRHAGRVKVILPWALIAVAVSFMALKHVIMGLHYTLLSQQPSPDGRHVIHEFRSHSDGPDHAPYGHVLSLSRTPIRHPDDGHVIFAGYCKPPLQYHWHGGGQIVVECEGRGAQPIRTQAVMAYGIGVELRAPQPGASR